jgi:hypothetical protein
VLCNEWFVLSPVEHSARCVKLERLKCNFIDFNETKVIYSPEFSKEIFKRGVFC